MVDPNVLDYVAANGYDNERVQGFAWGMGIERIAMLVHQVPDRGGRGLDRGAAAVAQRGGGVHVEVRVEQVFL